jgi:hypothetical protein
MGKLNVPDIRADDISAFFTPKSAQGYLKPAAALAGSRGSACGAGGDKTREDPKPGSCGSSCGAGDDGGKKEQPKPSACGAGDDAENRPAYVQ